MFGNKDEENDFFEEYDLPQTEPKPKEPQPEPENPDYWEEESEWEHLRPVRRWRVRLYAFIALCIFLILLTLGLWLFRPYVSEATQYGYVENIERRGAWLKTYEGELIPYKMIQDTTRPMERNFVFSTADHKAAKTLKQLQLDGMPARVEYEVYRSRLPWRGETKTIVVSADTADPRTLEPLLHRQP